jgi:hypothetical protein
MVQISVNFFSFILLWVVTFATGMLYFGVINEYFPDPLIQEYFDYASIYYPMAAVIVALPVYIWTMWFWFRGFVRHPEQQESKLSKWFTYLVLLAAAGTIVGDLIGVIYHFLTGVITVRFVLQALILFVVAGTVFCLYFFERRKVQYGKNVSALIFRGLGIWGLALIITGVVLGLSVAGSPQEARLRGFDAQRVENLNTITSSINEFYRMNRYLPKSLNELEDNVMYYVDDFTDPETGERYEYRTVGADQFELCAAFSFSTLGAGDAGKLSYVQGVWGEHDSGKVCKTQKVPAYPSGIYPY